MTTTRLAIQRGLLVLVAAGLAGLAACGTAPGQYVRDPQGTLVFVTMTPLQGAAPTARIHGAAVAYAEAQVTQEAAAAVMTSDGRATADSLQIANDLLQQTQAAAEVVLQLSAATSTEAHAETQDARTQIAIDETRTMAQTQNAVTARIATEAHGTQVAMAAATASWAGTQASHQATATQAHAEIAATTDAVTTWGPILLIIALGLTALVAAWRAMRIYEARNRVIARPNGAPLILQDQRGDIAQHLPGFLRWLAWFVEVSTVVYDPDRAHGPALVMRAGVPTAPALTDPDRQERVTRRTQTVQLAAAMVGTESTGAEGWQPAGTRLMATEAGQTEDVIEGEFRVVEPAQLQAWINEVRLKLPGAETDEARAEAHVTMEAR